jgi:hypothetical protein
VTVVSPFPFISPTEGLVRKARKILSAEDELSDQAIAQLSAITGRTLLRTAGSPITSILEVRVPAIRQRIRASGGFARWIRAADR